MCVDIFIKIKFKGNPKGTGEAAAVLEYKGRLSKPVILITKNETKNAIALKICIEALKKMVKPSKVVIHCENAYIKNALDNGWVKNWKAEGWKKAGGKELANAAEWKQFYMLSEIHEMRIEEYSEKHDRILEKTLEGAEE